MLFNVCASVDDPSTGATLLAVSLPLQTAGTCVCLAVSPLVQVLALQLLAVQVLAAQVLALLQVPTVQVLAVQVLAGQVLVPQVLQMLLLAVSSPVDAVCTCICLPVSPAHQTPAGWS
jgi:hypothetical protein